MNRRKRVCLIALSIASRLVIQGVTVEESIGDVRVKYAAASTDLFVAQVGAVELGLGCMVAT
jgi:hypothetical protein